MGRNQSAKKLNLPNASQTNLRENKKVKLHLPISKESKVTDILKQNTFTTTGKSHLFMKGILKNNIQTPKEIPTEYLSARNDGKKK